MIADYDQLRSKMKNFVDGNLSAKNLALTIDQFVSDDHVYSLPNELCEKILALQDEVAFYVFDPEMRKEHDSYIDEEQLKLKIEIFLKETTQ